MSGIASDLILNACTLILTKSLEDIVLSMKFLHPLLFKMSGYHFVT